MRPWPSLFGPAALISGGFMAALGGLLFFVRLPSTSAPSYSLPTESAFVRISKIDMDHPDILAEDADLLDPVPLFSPTRHNASELELPAQLHQDPGTHFAPFPARYRYTENSFDLSFPHFEPSPMIPADALDVGKTPNVFSEFGRRDPAKSALRDRLAFVEVVQAQTGALVYAQAITGGEPPGFPTGDWRPVEAIATVDVAGLVGAPTLATGASSGSDEVDTFLTQFLAKRFHLGGGMVPGVYVIRIGP